MKKKVIIGSVIGIAVVALVAVNIFKNNSSVQAFGGGGKAFNVKVAKLEKGSISSAISANGTVEVVEKAEVYLDAGLKIDKVLVEKNQKVSKGQKLVSLNMDAFYSELDQAKIKKKVQELNIQKTRLMDGTKSTAALEAAIVVAENNLKSAESAYNDRKKEYEDKKVLFEAGAVSKSELEMAEKAVESAQIALDNAKVNMTSSVDNLEETKKANSKSSDNTDLDLQTMEQNLKATILSIEDIEKRIKKVEESIFAPIDGIITEVGVKDSGVANGAQPSFIVTNIDKLQIRANVKEFDIRNIAAGQNVSVTGDAITKEDGVKGKVVSVAPVATKNMTTNGSETFFEVIVSIDGSSPVVKPGLGVTCNIFTQEKKDVVVVALDTLLTDKDDKNYLYVVDEKENIVRQKYVKLGITSDMNAEILEGLEEGELVVVDPQPTLKDGSKAKIINTDKRGQ